MKTVKLYGIGQNKFGDTDTRFKAQLLNNDTIVLARSMPIVANIANKSGFVMTVPVKEFEDDNVVIDFNDGDLKKLTPDDYWLEFEVTLEDGDIAKFPTDGGMPFTINQNLKSTTGKLVPTVTFQQVLDAVDAKVDKYVHTIQKGDKGDTGSTGPDGQNGKDGDVMQDKANHFTQTNTFDGTVYLGQLEIKSPIPYIDFHFNNASGDFTTRLIEYKAGELSLRNPDDTPATLHANVDYADTSGKAQIANVASRITTRVATFTNFIDVSKKISSYQGLWNGGSDTISACPEAGWFVANIISWSDVSDVGYIILHYTDHDAVWFGYSSAGTIQWTRMADNSKVLHNTGNETAAGDKSFTGSVIIQDANPVKVKQSATVEFNSWQSSKMKATRFGNIVSLRYSVNPNNDNKITKNQTSAVVIPQGYRPMEPWNMAVGGTVSSGSANITVNPNGTLSSGWQDAPYAGMMTAMYFTNDPFPS
ncbi:hypothetical protein [Leuconostoc citreum]